MSGKGQGYDGNAAEVRVRGNAYQVLEKYLQLARDAGTSGDRVAAENFLQHADHYYRVVAAMQEGQRPRIGGRDVSVAEVNVQNSNQGLSTALYSGHGQPGNAGAESDGADNDGNGKSVQGNGQNNSHQGNSHQNRGQQNGGRQGSGYQGGGHQGGGYQGGHQNSGNQAGNQGGSHQGEPQSGSGSTNDAVAPAPVQPNYAAPKTLDEQPEYPVELIPAAAPLAAGSEGNQTSGDADRNGPDRGGRGPARSRGRRPARRPREDGNSTPDTGDSGE